MKDRRPQARSRTNVRSDEGQEDDDVHSASGARRVLDNAARALYLMQLPASCEGRAYRGQRANRGTYPSDASEARAVQSRADLWKRLCGRSGVRIDTPGSRRARRFLRSRASTLCPYRVRVPLRKGARSSFRRRGTVRGSVRVH